MTIAMSFERYRYFKGDAECPISNEIQKTFWEWEKMYFNGFEEMCNEYCWEIRAEELTDRYQSGDLAADKRIDRILSYTPETLPVFCYIAAMKAKWFPAETEDWELNY